MTKKVTVCSLVVTRNNINFCSGLSHPVSHLPIGLISKKCIEVRRMALNMLLWRVWAEFTRTLKKTKLRRKPNTTEVAVKPDKSTEKKPIRTGQFDSCACSKISHWKHLSSHYRAYRYTAIFIQLGCFFPLMNAALSLWVPSLKEWRLRVTSRQSERSNSIRRERLCYLAVQLRPCTHTLGLEGLGPQPKNCGSVHWIAALIHSLESTQKAMCTQWASPA